ncbi:hsp70-binding protein 1 [Dermacentor silvarum]|uniref:hsp70-binding protein 1 n=1 Tax=Dermacentor silvarum TaxID=543639 RepID=UPI00189BB0BA|nr:hsp70-binding protein 1 [Dermacentor silvarum]
MAEDVAQPEPAERAADPQRLEASRIQWLTRAMQELLVNPYDEMRRSLRNIRECLRESHNIGRVLVACIANVQQFIDVVDYAKDFEKMGGFQVLPELLDYPSSLVRVGTCALIAELVQNNPHCQRAALRSASRLLRLLNTETDDEVRCKSLYALSCMVRQNKDAYANFEKLGGPVVLRRVLFETTNRRLKTKASFLVAALCSQEDGFRAALAGSEFARDAVEHASARRLATAGSFCSAPSSRWPRTASSRCWANCPKSGKRSLPRLPASSANTATRRSSRRKCSILPRYLTS